MCFNSRVRAGVAYMLPRYGGASGRVDFAMLL